MKKSYDCGIDLGTTNSCISVPNMDNTCAIINNSADNMQVTPSAVWVKGSRMIIGRRAYESTETKNVRREFKRDMGTDTVYRFAESGRELTPVDLSAEILKSLKADAEKRLNKEMRDAVVTVPAAFTLVQCEATKQAAQEAGFRNVILLQEPIAAAVAYGAKPGAKDQNWLVFDYGGGTLDVSVITTHGGRLETVTSKGDNYKGGKDLDRIFFEKVILPRLREDYDLSGAIPGDTYRKLLLAAEECKKGQSGNTAAFFAVDGIKDNSGAEIDIEYEFTRDEFEAAVRGEVDTAVTTARAALTASGIAERDIAKIVLVGGTTFIPLVRQRLREEFPDITTDISLNPMTVVSEGAALFAALTVTDDDTAPIDLSKDEYLLELEYDTMTSELTANVMGRITNADGKVSRVKIDCVADESAQTAVWTSGWYELYDKDSGAFDIDIRIINENGRNIYRVSAESADGSPCALIGYIFGIRHNETALKLAAPPLNASVGIMVADNDRNIIEEVFKKDTKLPVKSNPLICKLGKTLNPGTNDELEIYIFEGEHTYNPFANELFRVITISAKDLDRTLERGTEVEITLELDESRCGTLNIFVPLYDCELPETRFADSKKSRKNFETQMHRVETEIGKTKYALDVLRGKGVGVSGLEEEFLSIKQDFDIYSGLVNVRNDEVQQYITRFYTFQTKVIEKERGTREQRQETEDGAKLDRISQNITAYGDAAARKIFDDLQEQFEAAKSPDTRAFILDKMNGLENETLRNSFDWLKSAYQLCCACANNFCDMQKASYWQGEARRAIDNTDRNKLLEAVNNLGSLMIKTPGEESDYKLSDLMKK